MSKQPKTKPASTRKLTRFRHARRAAIAIMAIMANTSAALGGQPWWNTYTNPRYGYTGCYPTAFFTAQGESDDGSGQTFTSPDGAKIWMYGSYRAELPNPTLHNSMEEDESANLGAANKPTLQILKPVILCFQDITAPT